MTANIVIFALAAFFEIAGCFAFWMSLRRGATPLMAVLGVVSLIAFALALTRVDSAFAGRAYAAYSGDLHCRVTRVAVGGGTAGPNQNRRVGRSTRDHRNIGHHWVCRPSALTASIGVSAPTEPVRLPVLVSVLRHTGVHARVRPSRVHLP